MQWLASTQCKLVGEMVVCKVSFHHQWDWSSLRDKDSTEQIPHQWDIEVMQWKGGCLKRSQWYWTGPSCEWCILWRQWDHYPPQQYPKCKDMRRNSGTGGPYWMEILPWGNIEDAECIMTSAHNNHRFGWGAGNYDGLIVSCNGECEGAPSCVGWWGSPSTDI